MKIAGRKAYNRSFDGQKNTPSAEADGIIGNYAIVSRYF